MTEIAINCEGKPTMYFESNDDYIGLNDLNRYFPNAVGLTFVNNGKPERLNVYNDKLKFRPGIKKYEILRSTECTIELIKKYFFLRYTYKEICHLLLVQHNTEMCGRKLRRLLARLNLRRKNVVESPLEDIVTAVITEVEGPGMNIGYRAMWQRLRCVYNFTVKQSTVLKVLQIVDPDGIEARSRYKLKRRIYKVPGPNYLWHIDGFDKLKRYGFPIHGCVDGYSRKIIWLYWSTSNNNPRIIANYYLESIKKLNFLPSIIRSDRGTENTIIDLLQKALRYHHKDKNAGENSFIKGKSTANERIEKYWRQFRNHTADFFIDLFKCMEEKNVLDTSNIMHIECLRFLFDPLLQNHLTLSRKEWNQHRMRKQDNINMPSGIPNILFYWPERYGARDCSQRVDLQDIEILKDRYATEPTFFNPIVLQKLIQMLIPNFETPCTVKEAYNLLIKVTELIQNEVE